MVKFRKAKLKKNFKYRNKIKKFVSNNYKTKQISKEKKYVLQKFYEKISPVFNNFRHRNFRRNFLLQLDKFKFG